MTLRKKVLTLGSRLFHRLLHGEQLPLQSGLEPVYQRLFERDLARAGLKDEFYPVGYAANYSLLYAVQRAAVEYRPNQVVELGAGQTSLLLDRLKEAGHFNGDIVTVEHDRDWAAHVGEAVKHRVVRVDLVAAGPGKGAYDLSSLSIERPVNLLIIDGPVGGTDALRFSRHGALPLVDKVDREGFIIVVDDAERPGEAALCARIEESLRRAGIAFRRGAVVSNKRQDIFAGGRCFAAAYF